jgi:hypothetical protein
MWSRAVRQCRLAVADVLQLGYAAVNAGRPGCSGEDNPLGIQPAIGQDEPVTTLEDTVLRTFISDGRIMAVPAKRSRRLMLLDHVAQLFEIGVRYREPDVNRILNSMHDDHAALRRYLVDEGFLSRDHGEYWRSGGAVGI